MTNSILSKCALGVSLVHRSGRGLASSFPVGFRVAVTFAALMFSLISTAYSSALTGVDASIGRLAKKKSPSVEVMDEAIRNNENAARLFMEFGSFSGLGRGPLALGALPSVRPFADYENTGYIFISDQFTFDSQEAKEAIARNLPKGMTLVIFTEDATSSRPVSIRKNFEKFLAADRLKVISLENASDGFWARDGLPVPVIEETGGALGLVDARYYYPFEPDEEVGLAFKSLVRSHRFNFEGGNFMANHKGHCILVNNSSHSKIPDNIFENLYGCKKIQRMPHVSGIGHIDEHVRFVSEDTVMTDLASYKKDLEASGLKVIMLPRPENEMETYVNSVIMNGVAIVPIFGQDSDREALDVYKAAGFKAVGADSTSLSNNGEGSIHCITMTYPPMPLTALMKELNASGLKAKELQ